MFKKLVSIIIAVAMVFALVPNVQVSATTFEGFGWSYSNGTLTVSISGGTTVWREGRSAATFRITDVTSVIIENSVTWIGEEAFQDCRNLSSITIPDSVTWIGPNAFQDCRSLTSITIPDSVTGIGWGAFSDCRSLTEINVNAGNTHFTSIDGVLFSKDVKTLIRHPEGKTNTAYIIPNSVTSIGNGAFSGCTSLTSVTIPDSVTSIGGGAFSGCRSLTSINIPDSVTSIDWGAFSSCTNLTAINVNSGNTHFTSIVGVLFSKDVKTLIAYPGGKAGAYTIPNSVTSIGELAFSFCRSLTSITIPNSVKSIGSHAFVGCTSLTSITIPDSVTSIGTGAFFGLSLTSVTFKGATPPAFSGKMFGATTLTIYVPKGAKAAYEEALAGQLLWGNFSVVEGDFEADPVDCPNCGKEVCECVKVEVCEVCGKETCECAVDETCKACGEDPCECVAITVIGDATVTITPGLMISIGGAPFEADPDKLTLKVEKKTPGSGETEKFFAALKTFLE